MPVKILGVDPGTRVTGYGIIEEHQSTYRLIDYGCIKPPPKMRLSDRYRIIHQSVSQLIQEHQPDALSVETQFVQKNVQTAIKLGMARGMILLAASQAGVPIFEYSPTKAKSAVVGNGKATKFQVQSMCRVLLNLKEIPEPDDAADALALAICHAQDRVYQKALGQEI